MPKFKFRAMNVDGSLVEGTQNAPSRDAAFESLKQRGLYPLRIVGSSQTARIRKKAKLSPKSRIQFVRQLATLLNAGVSLLDTMESLSKSGSDELIAERSRSMSQQLRQGERLGSVLRTSFPELPEYVFSLAELGESTGQLGKALVDAADRLAADHKLASDIRSALTYPAVLASVGAFIILGMFLFVIPRFGALIDRSEADVPYISKVIIDTGIWLRAHWLVLPVAAVAIILLVRFGIPKAKAQLIGMARRLPLLGGILMRSELERWARTLGVALSNGAELLHALDLASGAVKSPQLKSQLESVRRDVRGGMSIDEAFRSNIETSDPLLLDLMSTGRKSGTLPRMLMLAADGYKQDVETLTKRLTAIAEPAAILILSLIVGGLVVSIVLAMTSIYQIDVS